MKKVKILLFLSNEKAFIMEDLIYLYGKFEKLRSSEGM